MYEDFLPLVAKPSRYINNEINAIHKDLSKVKTKVCLFFPDAYEVGMSHLGLRILYHILNSRSDTACERVFSPWTDYEEHLRTSGRPLTSIESNLPLAQFDIIGVTLQCELSYSNVLAGLDLAYLPLRAAQRTADQPVIIAGGPCAVNPEPLSAFIDVFFIGEAEEAIHEIVELRQVHKNKCDFLEALAQREGYYVPSLGRRAVRRRFIKHLDSASYPDQPLLPLLKPIHDRVTVEVARGCIRGCRFCQAGIIYRPYRERSMGQVKNLLRKSLHSTGYDELSLASLSAGDYSDIEPLMQDLVRNYQGDRISISLPSLRIGTLTTEMIRAVAGVRKSGFTLAPEAGTERLRRVINKPVSDSDLLSAAETIFSSGWSVLKLYFMIGLPTETDKDLDGIIKLAQEILVVGRKSSKRNVQIHITVSTFVPKPHTPFQWFGQATRKEIKEKQAYLAKGLQKKGIVFKPHDSKTSLLESALARGDGSIGAVIEEAVRRGCRFDGWTERFDFSKWEQAFLSCGMDPTTLASRSYEPADELPWDHIHSGVTKKFLQSEYEQALAAEITENCRAACEHCGIGCRDGGSTGFGKSAVSQEALTRKMSDTIGDSCSNPTKKAYPMKQDLAVRYRMKFTKRGRLRFLSHLDLMTLFQRAAARAQVPIAFSHGFNPHPKLSFGPALPVGVESSAEYLDMEICWYTEPQEIMKNLNRVLPEGIGISDSRVISSKAPSLSASIRRYVYEVDVPMSFADNLEERVKTLLSHTSLIVEKEGKQKELRPCIESISVSTGASPSILEIVLLDRNEFKPRFQDVLKQLFALENEQLHAFQVRRVGMFSWDKTAWKNPMEISGY
ncbi:MAG TPA: TIGR03960 family B12-binding radical SAM protein [Nitrospirota bacterium]|nr:TIGR03960 family B12-binding radical SAM protein [Nitrospirota bacterium]